MGSRRRLLSNGIKAESDGEWNAPKHSSPKQRIWRKLHNGINGESQEVRALEVTGYTAGGVTFTHPVR